MANSSFLIAQITDTHLCSSPNQEFFGIHTDVSLQTVLHQIATLEPRPDLLLLTGDLSQDSSVASYARLREGISALEIPTVWLPGNHDDPARMAAILTRSPFIAQKSLHVGGWQVLLLDTSVPGCVQGELSAASLAWLDQELGQSTVTPALIALHHPPVAIGSEWMDQIGLRNAADFFAVCDRHPRLKLTVFGHIHQEFACQRQGVHYFGTPSTCIQFKPNSAQLALDDVPLGFRLIHLFSNGTWQTAIHRVADFAQGDEATVAV